MSTAYSIIHTNGIKHGEILAIENWHISICANQPLNEETLDSETTRVIDQALLQLNNYFCFNIHFSVAVYFNFC